MELATQTRLDPELSDLPAPSAEINGVSHHRLASFYLFLSFFVCTSYVPVPLEA